MQTMYFEPNAQIDVCLSSGLGGLNCRLGDRTCLTLASLEPHLFNHILVIPSNYIVILFPRQCDAS